MDNGWVLLHRKICENELWLEKPFSKGQAWVDLFLNANHTKGGFWVRGVFVDIDRGQIGWSELTMSKRWGWSRDKTRRFLNWLETRQQIIQQKSPLTSITTILNYETHQKTDVKTRQQTRQQTNNRKTSDDTQTKNDKEELNNDKEIIAAKPPDEVNLLLGYFKENINPHINFGNKTERQACKDLIETYGLERVKTSLGFLQQRRKTDNFLPLVATPFDLWTKWAKIKQHLETKKKGKIWKPTTSALRPFQQEAK